MRCSHKAWLPNGAHKHMVTPRGSSSEGNSVGSIGESLEYESIQTETMLQDSALVEVEMRNGEVGMKYVKYVEVGWKRSKKRARSEDGNDEGIY